MSNTLNNDDERATLNQRKGDTAISSSPGQREDIAGVRSPSAIQDEQIGGYAFKTITEEIGFTNHDSKNIPVSAKPVTAGIRNIIIEFRRKCRNDAVYSENLRHTLFLAMSLFASCMVISQSGPTFLDLQIITDTDVGQASVFITSLLCGALLGASVSGYISGSKVNANLSLLLSLLFMGLTAISIPYCSILPAMIAVQGLTGLFGGFNNAAVNAEHMRIWGKDGPALMQLLHFCASVGGLVSALVTEPFVAERQDDTSAHGHNANFDAESVGHINNTTSSLNQSYHVELQSRETNIHWAFLITGTVAMLTSIPFAFLYKKSKHVVKKSEEQQTEIGLNEKNSDPSSKSIDRKIPTAAHILLVLGLSAFFVMYSCSEIGFSSFLMTFVVRRFRTVSKSDAAYINAVYWGSFAASRFLMIFVSRALRPVRVLYVGGSLMLLSFTGFTVSSGPWMGGGGSDPTHALYANASVGIDGATDTQGDIIARAGGDEGGSVPALTFFAALVGLAMSGVFPASLSWAEAELLKVTGRVASCVFSSAALGGMLNPLLVSRLMQNVSNMWFCYVLLLEVSGVVVLFCSLLVFNRCYLNQRYGKLHGSRLDLVVVVAAASGDDDDDDDDDDNDDDDDDDDEAEQQILTTTRGRDAAAGDVTEAEQPML